MFIINVLVTVELLSTLTFNCNLFSTAHSGTGLFSTYKEESDSVTYDYDDVSNKSAKKKMNKPKHSQVFLPP
jgi:hypothetical protein